MVKLLQLMSKNNEVVSVVISTRKIDETYVSHVKKMFSHPKTQILIYENDGEKSLTQIYNLGLKDSENDIVVFMHDDLILETPNMTPKIVKLFEKHSEYGHIHEGKRHVNKYSKGSYNDVLKDVVIVDGLFFAVHKGRIKKEFNEQFEGFHFYDISFCVENLLEGVKIGLTTKFGVTHLSIGMTNKKWEKNKLFFEALFDKNIPLTS